MSQFALRPSLDLQLTRMGREGEPLLEVGRVLEQPEELVDYAADAVRFEPAGSPTGGYPGLRAPAPLNYVGALVRKLDPLIQRAFDLQGVKLARAECRLSMVTRHPSELAPLQRIPHVDTVDDLQFALLHYLCDERMGGTAFYRHRATGYEAITPDRQAHYNQVRDFELQRRPDLAGYIAGDTDDYEQLAVTAAAFDKVVVYRSRLLHSGAIPPGLDLSPDPRRGRLTANIFINYRR